MDDDDESMITTFAKNATDLDKAFVDACAYLNAYNANRANLLAMLDPEVILCDKHQETNFGKQEVTDRLDKEYDDDGPLVFTANAHRVVKVVGSTGTVKGRATWVDENNRGNPKNLKYHFKFNYVGPDPGGIWMIAFIHSKPA